MFVLFVAHMNEKLHEGFSPMWGREPWIHLPFIYGGWGGYILGDHPFLFSPLYLADCPGPRFSHKQPSGILSVPHIYLLQDLLQVGWRISQLGVWEYTWNCSDFRVDFSPITCISVIAGCLVERAASALGISRTGGRSPRTPVVCCIFN